MKKLLNLVLIFFFMGIPASYPSDRLSWPDFKTDLPFDKSIKTGKLDNGFRYLIKKNNTPEKRAAAYLGVMAGSLFENDNEKGLAHFLEHMVFCGSENFGPGELVKYFQRIGMEFGADTNAHTGFNETVYKIYLPKGSEEEISQAFTILRDFVSGALILESEVDRERGVILAEKVSRDSVSYRTRVKEYNFLFNGLIFPKRFPIGSEDIIRNTGSRELKAFYRAWYTPERMVLAVTGDVDDKAVSRLINKYFSTLEKPSFSKPVPEFGKLEELKGLTTFFHHEKEAGSVDVSLNIREDEGFFLNNIKYEMKWLRRYIAMEILSNRLNALLEKEDRPYQSAFSFAFPFLDRVLWSRIGAKTDVENYEKTLGTLIYELKRARLFGFEEREVSRVKNEIFNMFDRSIEKADTRDTKELASEFISSAMSSRIIVSPEDEKKIYTKKVKELSKEEIEKAFNEIWNRKEILVSITGNLELKGDGKEEIKKKANLFFEKEVVESKKNDEKTFPYLVPKKAGHKIIEKKEFKETGIKRIVLDNNICINFKKTDFKKDSIVFKASFGKGSAYEPESLKGISLLLPNLINLSGLNSISMDELRASLSGKSVNLYFGVEAEKLYFKGSSSKKDIKTLFLLLYHYFNDPGMKKSAYSLAMERLKSDYEKNIRSVDGNLYMEGRYFFSGHDHRFLTPSPEILSGISLKNIRDYLDDDFKNSGIEISFVGDFDEDLLEDLIMKYFSSFNKRDKIKKETPLPIFFPIGREKLIKVDTKIESAFVSAGIKTDDIYPIDRSRRLGIGARIISERLRENIREKLGASYSPFAYHSPNRLYQGYGGMYLGVKTSPKMISRVKKEIRNIIKDISRKEITDDEFKRSVSPLINSIKTGRQENGYWLETVLDGSYSNPRQIKWSKTILNSYSSISKDMVEHELRKYIRLDKISFLIIKSK